MPSGENMGDSQKSAVPITRPEYHPKKDERRSQSRKDGVLSKIEDATYEVLRKHEKKSA
jgi:hypothetical protein